MRDLMILGAFAFPGLSAALNSLLGWPADGALALAAALAGPADLAWPLLTGLFGLVAENLPAVVAVLAGIGAAIYWRVSKASEAAKTARLGTIADLARGLAAVADVVTPITPTERDNKLGPALRALADAMAARGLPPLKRSELAPAKAALVAAGVVAPADLALRAAEATAISLGGLAGPGGRP